MGTNPRCLLVDKIESFLSKEKETTFGIQGRGMGIRQKNMQPVYDSARWQGYEVWNRC